MTTKSEFDERVGPFYTVASVAALRDCDESAVLRDILRHHLLAIVLTDDVIALPTRQFNDAGEPLPRLRDVWESLGADNDYLALALVILTRSQTFEGQTGAEWLRDGRTQEVLAVTDRIRRALEN